MSWSEALRAPLKLLALLALLAVAATLSACSSVRPLYGADAVQPGRYAFHYAEPRSRLDQVVYSELRLRLGPDSTAPDALLVTVTTGAGSGGLTRTGTAKPTTPRQVSVTASVTVTAPDGRSVFSGTRAATAMDTTSSQVLGDVEGYNDTAERGARAVADQLRLAILGALAKGH